jgi:hypothetical protein
MCVNLRNVCNMEKSVKNLAITLFIQPLLQWILKQKNDIKLIQAIYST